MPFLQLLTRFQVTRQIERLAETLASQHHAGALARLEQRPVQPASVAEARGYVRAHCSGAVRKAAQRLVLVHRLPDWGQAQLARQATDCLVETVARDLFTRRPALAHRRAG